jgi:hypothetical protein
MTPADCIRAAIPGADDALCDHIVWGRTPFPFTKLSARDFYRAARCFKRAQDHGISLCDFCDNIAVNKFCCKACDDALHQPHPDSAVLRPHRGDGT